MASLEDALVTYLLSQTTLTTHIDRRLKYDLLPEGSKFPSLVMINIDDIKLHALSGQTSLESPNIQFTVYAVTRTEVETIGEVLKTLLSDFQGTMAGVPVQYMKLTNELKSTDTIADGTTKIKTMDLEYEINFTKE